MLPKPLPPISILTSSTEYCLHILCEKILDYFPTSRPPSSWGNSTSSSSSLPIAVALSVAPRNADSIPADDYISSFLEFYLAVNNYIQYEEMFKKDQKLCEAMAVQILEYGKTDILLKMGFESFESQKESKGEITSQISKLEIIIKLLRIFSRNGKAFKLFFFRYNEKFGRRPLLEPALFLLQQC